MVHKYLKPLHDNITNKLKQSIPNILQYLFDTYGNILAHRKSEPCTINWRQWYLIHKILQRIPNDFLVASKSRIQNFSLTRNEQTLTKVHFWFFQKNIQQTGALSINESMNQDDMSNLISQNGIDTTHSVLNLQSPDELPALKDVPRPTQQDSLLLELANRVEKLGDQLVLNNTTNCPNCNNPSFLSRKAPSPCLYPQDIHPSILTLRHNRTWHICLYLLPTPHQHNGNWLAVIVGHAVLVIIGEISAHLKNLATLIRPLSKTKTVAIPPSIVQNDRVGQSCCCSNNFSNFKENWPTLLL